MQFSFLTQSFQMYKTTHQTSPGSSSYFILDRRNSVCIGPRTVPRLRGPNCCSRQIVRTREQFSAVTNIGLPTGRLLNTVLRLKLGNCELANLQFVFYTDKYWSRWQANEYPAISLGDATLDLVGLLETDTVKKSRGRNEENEDDK